jgi:DNA (cytosine-5)-methyltransferase 1
MNVLDLFSGIGGFSVGLERAGMRTVAFCEIEPYCQAVLRKHWPDVPVFDDVRTLTAEALGITQGNGCGSGRPRRPDSAGQGQQQSNQSLQIDVICGGFPCQDISVAGKGAGLKGERSGLWSEFARLIGELRPRYVIVENVAALLGRGLGDVLGDLAALGYDAEWHCIPASAVGAPHRRDRVWIVAYPQYIGQPYSGNNQFHDTSNNDRQTDRFGSCNQDVADAAQQHVDRSWHPRPRWRLELANGGWWLVEPDVGRVAHGVRNRVDRLKGLGNAIVPQIAEILGKAIMSHEHERIS